MLRIFFATVLFLIGVCEPQFSQAQEQVYSTEQVRESESLYREAFELYVAGDTARALARLKELARDYPNTPAGKSARRILDIAEMTREPTDQSQKPPLSDTSLATQAAPGPDVSSSSALEKRSSRHRLELIIGQTIHGFFLGGEFCVLLGCEVDGDAFPTSIIIGGLVAGSLMIGLTDSSIPPGLSTSVNSGTLWGGWHAVAIYVGADGAIGERPSAGLFIAAQTLGTLGGYMAYKQLGLTEDHVAVGNTLGVWSGVFGALIHASLADGNYRPVVLTALIVGDLGLVGGLLAAPSLGISRKRTYALDAGAVLGALIAGSFPAMFTQGDIDTEWALFRMALGIPMGMGLAYIITSSWDADPTASLTLYPTEDGAGVALVGTF